MSEYQGMTISHAVQLLAQTDDLYGQARGYMKSLEHKLKVAKSIGILESQKKTGVEKEADAYSSEHYQSTLREYEQACIDAETLGAKRKTAELTISVWQTQNANRRKGNIV